MEFKHLILLTLCSFLLAPPLFCQECAVKDDIVNHVSSSDKAASDQEKEDSNKRSDKNDDDDDKEDDDEDKDDDDDEEKALKIGILAFPSAQQLSPLISFGQNVFDKGVSQWGFFGDLYTGRHRQYYDLVPNYIYAITDEFSIYIEALDYAIYRDGNQHTHGPEDTLFQLEYAFYNEETKYYVDQSTIVAGLYLPSGSGSYRVPNTGFGTPAIFLGSTFSRTGSFWYWFTSYGAVLTFSEDGRKIGNQYLYQMGIGHYLARFKPNWLLCWLIEVDGQYSEHNKYKREDERDSGGSFVYITPSIWLSNCDWRFQFGAGFPVQQHLFGQQSRLSWVYVLDIVYTAW